MVEEEVVEEEEEEDTSPPPPKSEKKKIEISAQLHLFTQNTLFTPFNPITPCVCCVWMCLQQSPRDDRTSDLDSKIPLLKDVDAIKWFTHLNQLPQF